MFEPRLALASLSGEADATWARAGSEFVGCAFLGGIALDDPTRKAARSMLDRDREEFLPPDPITFVDDQLTALDDTPIRPGFNVRTTSHEPLRSVATVCADHDAILEINAHCRQAEMCAVGAGETLLRDVDRLVQQVRVASDAGADVSVKVRAELDDVDLIRVTRAAAAAGGDCIHVDAMDSEGIVREIVDAADLFVIANNGVRDRATVREYLEYGADAVSVGRPSDNPYVLQRVSRALTAEVET